jgi:hypothetical protein
MSSWPDAGLKNLVHGYGLDRYSFLREAKELLSWLLSAAD